MHTVSRSGAHHRTGAGYPKPPTVADHNDGMSDTTASTPWVSRINHAELALRRRYEIASIINDLLIAGWFIVGSLLFFNDSTTTLGTWLFLIGSVELAIRPTIRLTRHLHLRRIQHPAPHESDQDF